MIRAWRASSVWLLFGVHVATSGGIALAVEEEPSVDAEPAVIDSAGILEAAFQFTRAKLLADEGDFEEALAAYERALELDGSDPYSRIEVAKFHSYLAQISRSAQKRLDALQAAAGYAGEARRLAPENIEILRDYAQIHIRLGEHQLGALKEAQGAYEELREKTEGDLQVLTSLGQIYLWQQKHEQAVGVLQEAASYLPNHRMILTMLLEALVETNKKSDAEEVLAKLVKIESGSLEYHLRLAELRSERGDHKAAAEGLSSAPERVLANPRLRRALAQELHLSGASQAAWEITEELKTEVPYGPGMRRLRVAILASLLRYDEAIAELQPGLDSERDKERRAQDTLHLSRLLERVGRYQEAATVLEKRLEEPDVALELNLKLALVGVLDRHERSDEAIALLEQEIETSDVEDLPVFAQTLSDVLNRAGKSQRALDNLDRTIGRLRNADHQQSIDGLKLRRLTYLGASEDWATLAEEAAQLAKSSTPEISAAGTLFLADALAGQDRVDEAIATLEKASLENTAPRWRAKQAEILLAANRDSEAAELLNVAPDSESTDDLLLAAQVYQRAERYQDSIPLLKSILSEHEDSLQALFLLGAAHERSGTRDAAVDAFERLLELAPNHAPTLNYLGYMWAEVGENLDAAKALILRAVALDPDNGAYVDSLGWVYFQLGRYEEALSHLEWAARLIPDDATIFEHLGDLYAVLDDAERARASYEQALDLGGDDLDGLRRKLETLEQKDL